jgi:hypothetical protein
MEVIDTENSELGNAKGIDSDAERINVFWTRVIK